MNSPEQQSEENEQKPKIEFIPKTPNGYFGGAWKVAYADFVTAMMAFFLLMWLLNATTEEQRSGIADYFDPKVPISQTSAGGMGMFNGDSVFAQNKLARNGLGGSGRKASSGREEKERHEVSSNEDVWRTGEEKTQFIGNSADGTKTGRTEFENQAQAVEGEIKRQLEQVSPNQGLAKQLNFKMTDEGLRIDITDNGDVPMFQSGSDAPTKKMQQIMDIVGTVVAGLENEISITGHTDSIPFQGKRNFGNWELSSQRAHAARRGLLRAGIEETRIKRIEGRADREPLDPNDTKNAVNRRIGIVLLRDTSPEAMAKENTKNSEPFEQDKLLQNEQRSLGSQGTGATDLFIPDQRNFKQ